MRRLLRNLSEMTGPNLMQQRRLNPCGARCAKVECKAASGNHRQIASYILWNIPGDAQGQIAWH